MKHTILALSAAVLFAGCGQVLPPAHDALDIAKNARPRAQALFEAVCVPPLVSELADPCLKLAEALGASDSVIASLEVALAAIEEQVAEKK